MVHPVSVCRSWGWGEAHKDVSGWYFSKTGGLPPPLCYDCSPYSPALPATVVQVEQESVIPEFLKGLVVVPVHVACGGPKKFPSGNGLGYGSRDMEQSPGVRLKPRA